MVLDEHEVMQVQTTEVDQEAEDEQAVRGESLFYFTDP